MDDFEREKLVLIYENEDLKVNLRQLDDALESFRQLLVYESQQPPQQQAAYLREFLFVFKVNSAM